MTQSARHVQVRGRVQGVAFRWHARDQAAALGVAGWIRNLSDGSVEAWIEGEPAALDALVDWMRAGPPAARVSALRWEEAQARGCADFEGRGDAHL